jgi:predicted transposase YbfD/YdcC
VLILEVLDEVPDPRRYNSQHALTDLLFVALAAVLCGAKSCTDMAMFAEGRLELLRQFVPLRGGVPSHDTFSRVLGALDPAVFQTCFQRFLDAFGQQARYERQAAGHVAVDGKGLRRAYEKGCARMPLMVVTLFDCDLLMSLRQVVTETGCERAATVEALNLLSLEGSTVTGDALHASPETTRTIRRKHGHYVLALKANNSTLYKAAQVALSQAIARGSLRVHTTEESGHGRHERRQAAVISFQQPACRSPLVDFVAVGQVETWRTVSDKTTHAIRYFALSQLITAERFLRLVRGHWSIENQLHWQLDVLMAEDESRTRSRNGPANLAILRRLALNILRSEPTKIPLRHKGLKARWNDQELLKLMTHLR